MVVPLSASQHPVPLPADFEEAECIGCHADKREGKFVHAVAAVSCTARHQVESTVETTVTGLTAEPEELCAGCHESSGGNLHVPYAGGRCIICHNPHGSQAPALINFDLSIVGPSRTGRLGYTEIGRGQARCYLTCHGHNHDPANSRAR